MRDCPFCKRIAAGEYEAWTNDPAVVWFEPLNPVTPGHMLFVPVCHVADALQDPYTTALTAEYASRWWSKNWGRSGARDCNLITSVGPAATQTVQHLHLHLVPRRDGDGLPLPWTIQVSEASRVPGRDGFLARSGSFGALVTTSGPDCLPRPIVTV
jgi:histidine triad (HIT) family protein